MQGLAIPEIEMYSQEVAIAGSKWDRWIGQLQIGLDIRVKLKSSLSPTDNFDYTQFGFHMALTVILLLGVKEIV